MQQSVLYIRVNRLRSAENFWRSVRKTRTCWRWTGRTDIRGAGLVYWDGKQMSAHRLAWILTHGDPGSGPGSFVRQSCGTPECVRPDHLYLGNISRHRCSDDFWKRLKKRPNGCWEWTAARANSDGYGGFTFQGKYQQTHRLAWTLTHGEIPKGKHVLHSCDNPPCCNPAHLFLGTDSDNQADRKAKGRGNYLRGSQVALARMTEDLVREVRAKHDGKHGSISRLAREYNISVPTMHQLIRGKTWRHVQ